jgi:hypothetical protein
MHLGTRRNNRDQSAQTVSWPPTQAVARVQGWLLALTARRPGRGRRRPPEARAELVGHNLDDLAGAAVLSRPGSLLEPPDDYDAAASVMVLPLSVPWPGELPCPWNQGRWSPRHAIRPPGAAGNQRSRPDWINCHESCSQLVPSSAGQPPRRNNPAGSDQRKVGPSSKSGYVTAMPRSGNIDHKW